MRCVENYEREWNSLLVTMESKLIRFSTKSTFPFQSNSHISSRPSPHQLPFLILAFHSSPVPQLSSAASTVSTPLLSLIILAHSWVLSFVVSLSGSSLCHGALSFQVPAVASLFCMSPLPWMLVFLTGLWFLSGSFHLCAFSPEFSQLDLLWKQRREKLFTASHISLVRKVFLSLDSSETTALKIHQMLC